MFGFDNIGDLYLVEHMALKYHVQYIGHPSAQPEVSLYKEKQRTGTVFAVGNDGSYSLGKNAVQALDNYNEKSTYTGFEISLFKNAAIEIRGIGKRK